MPEREDIPVDGWNRPVAAGTLGYSFEFDTTGSFQPVVLPLECKRITIVCRGEELVYTHVDSPQEFHYSFQPDGTGWMPATQLKFSIAKNANATLCYVRGPVGLKFAVAVVL